MPKFKITIAIPLATDSVSVLIPCGGIKSWDEYVTADDFQCPSNGSLIFFNGRNDIRSKAETQAVYAAGKWLKVERVKE